MPFQPVNKETQMRAGPYGHNQFDENADWHDPYWVQISDDGQYLSAFDLGDSQLKIFEPSNGVWELSDTKPSSTQKSYGTADIHPENDTVLYTDQSTVKEYDLETGNVTTLFSVAGENVGATYWPEDRSKIQLANNAEGSVSIRNRDGTVHDGLQQSGIVPAWGGINWNEHFGLIFASRGNTLRVFDSSTGDELGYLPGNMGLAHVYARGPYMTVGSTLSMGLIMENTGVIRGVYPDRTNVATIRFPPGREGAEFVGTYIFSQWRYPEQTLNQSPTSVFKQTKKVSLDASGKSKYQLSIFCHPQETVRVTTRSTADCDHRIAEPETYLFSDKFPTPLIDSNNANTYPIPGKEKTATQNAQFDVEGYIPAIAEVEISSGTADVTFEVQRGHQ